MLKSPETIILYDEAGSNMHHVKTLLAVILTWSCVDSSVNNVSSAAFLTEDIV